MKNTRPANSYNNFHKNKVNTAYEKYTPGTIGKIALGITVPSALIAFVSVMVAVFGVLQALSVTIITFLISFVGSLVIAVDIVIFNRKQVKRGQAVKEPKEMDIMRLVHMAIGIAVGIIIGYLIWGIKH